jgi:hypothetical protein
VMAIGDDSGFSLLRAAPLRLKMPKFFPTRGGALRIVETGPARQGLMPRQPKQRRRCRTFLD